MIILMDVGNTRIKLGWQHPGLGREAAAHAITLNPLADLRERLRKWLTSLPVQPTAALGVNVAGHVVAEHLQQTLREIHCTLQWIIPSASQAGVTNGYAQPEQLGADRWVSMLGLAARFKTAHPPLVLATFGTATTIDTLNASNHFEGGLILPGPALMRQSLAQGTANLPLASGAGTDYPRQTLQAISTGVVAAQAGAVHRQCLITQEKFGVAPVLCVSGGGWPEVEQEVRRLMGHLQIEVLANPVLDGLAHLVPVSG